VVGDALEFEHDCAQAERAGERSAGAVRLLALLETPRGVLDAPAIAGASPDLHKVHPEAKDAPVLQLVNGWEPCWTYAEIGVQK